MKLPKTFDFPTNEKIAISDTKELNARKLLALFLDAYDPFGYLLEEHFIIKELLHKANSVRNKTKRRVMSDAVSELIASICTGFMEFLAECPHIHIVID